MSRPKLLEGGRVHTLRVRLTVEEVDALIKAAGDKGQRVSDFVRGTLATVCSFPKKKEETATPPEGLAPDD